MYVAKVAAADNLPPKDYYSLYENMLCYAQTKQWLQCLNIILILKLEVTKWALTIHYSHLLLPY